MSREGVFRQAPYRIARLSPLSFFLQREVIIVLALAGAGIATLGSYLSRRKSRVRPGTARLILRVGYAITWGSVALFIVAGFVGE